MYRYLPIYTDTNETSNEQISKAKFAIANEYKMYKYNETSVTFYK